MFNLLLKLVFYIITGLFSLIVSPFVALVTALFPDLTSVIQNFLHFLTDYVVSYIPFIIKSVENLLGIPHSLIVLFISFIGIEIEIFAVTLAMKFGIRIYKFFKP